MCLELECIMGSEISQSSRFVKRQTNSRYFTHMWHLKDKTDEHMGGSGRREGNKSQEILKEREQTEGWCREVGGRELDGR